MKIRVRVYDPMYRLIRTDVLDLERFASFALDYRGSTGWLAIGRIEIERTEDEEAPGTWEHFDRCTGCGKPYYPGGLCLEHGLCGLCPHPDEGQVKPDPEGAAPQAPRSAAGA